MNRNFFIKCVAAVIIFPVLLSISGCTATKKIPISMTPGFSPDAVDMITVFPVVDLRFDKSDKLSMENVDNWMLKNVERILKKFGYQVILMSDRAMVSGLTEDDLSGKSTSWIKQAAPSSSSWVLITGLVDCESKLTFGSTGTAEVTGFFYNTNDGSVIWHDKGVGKVGQGGLAGMAMKGMMTHDAVVMATNVLMASFPEKRKK